MKPLEPYQFWNNVDHLLDAAGYNLTVLAEKAGITYGTISVQRARQTMPKVDQLTAMATALDISLEILITGEDEIHSQLSSRAIRIARACEEADIEDLFVIEKILGIKKATDHTVSREEAG